MPGAVHFEINADNAERAAAFCSKAFNWKPFSASVAHNPSG